MPTNPRPRFPSLLVPALAFVAMTIPACVDASATRPVLAKQRETIGQIALLSAQDAIALRAAVDTLLDAQRERLLASIEIDLVEGSLDARGGAPDDAPGWLVDYSSLLRLGAGADERRATLVHLPSVREFDESAAALRAALDARSLALGAMIDEVLADNAALADAAGATVDLADASRGAAKELWRVSVLDRIEDPVRREATARLLDNLLNPSN